MNKLVKALGLGLLIAGGAGYAYWQYQGGQAVQWAQLQALDDTLAGLNGEAQQANDYVVQRMQAAAESTHNVEDKQQQAQVRRLLHAAKQVQSRTRQLRDTLQQRREQLLRQTGNSYSADLLRHPTATVVLAFAADSPQPSLPAQLGAYARYINALYQADSLGHFAPIESLIPAQWPRQYFQGTQPVGLALATLTQLEADLLACEAGALQQLSPPLGPRRIPRTLLAVATAETNVVAAGATYKAQLYLVNSLYGPGISMTCNGRPVLVGPDGLGEVSFRAPMQPGAASWRGTVQARFGGRDSTFEVRVPYRVAHP